MVETLIELGAKLVFGTIRAAWWLVKETVKLVSGLIVAAVKLVPALIATGIYMVHQKPPKITDEPPPEAEPEPPPGPGDMRVQALRLGMELQPDGSARRVHGGVAFTLRQDGMRWRMEADRLNRPLVAVTHEGPSVPADFMDRARALAEDATEPTEVPYE